MSCFRATFVTLNKEVKIAMKGRGLGPGAIPRPVVVRTVHLRVRVDVPHPLRTGGTAHKHTGRVRQFLPESQSTKHTFSTLSKSAQSPNSMSK